MGYSLHRICDESPFVAFNMRRITFRCISYLTFSTIKLGENKWKKKIIN